MFLEIGMNADYDQFTPVSLKWEMNPMSFG